MPHIDTFVLGEYQTNCFVLTVPGPPDAAGRADRGAPCWIIDCGLDPAPMLDAIETRGLVPQEILLTHAHLDHIAGVDAALARFGPMPISIHVAEAGFCSDPMLNLSALIGTPVTCTEPDRTLRDGDELDLGGAAWRVVHAPGHSPGCALFIHDASKQAIVGDTLFAGSIGRIDFPTSDPAAMRRTLAMLMRLPDDLEIHPGHGPATTIGTERRTNPYVARGMNLEA